jgi:hypothetical protein
MNRHIVPIFAFFLIGSLLGGVIGIFVGPMIVGAPAADAPPATPRDDAPDRESELVADRGDVIDRGPYRRDTRGPAATDDTNGTSPRRTTPGDTISNSPAPAPVDPIEYFLPDEPILKPTGDGTITGTIRTSQGAGVPNATVRAEVARAPDGTGPVDAPPRWGGELGEDDLRDYVRRAKERAATTWQATTDGSGRFVIEGLPTGREYRVRAWATGYRIETMTGQEAAEVMPDETDVVLTANPIGGVELNVRWADGRPLDAARVSWGGRQSAVWTPDNRVIQLDPGRYTMQAVDEPDELGRSDEVEVVVTDGSSERIDLVLNERAGIRGRLIFEDGAASGQLILRWVRIEGTPPKPEELASARQGVGFGRIGADLRYAIRDIDPGTYMIAAVRYAPQPTTVAHATVQVGKEGMVTQDLSVAAPSPDDFVLVWVADPNGLLLSNVRISAREEGANNRGGRGFNRSFGGGGSLVERTPEGAFRLYHPNGAERGDTVEVTADSSLYGEMKQTYTVGSAREVRMNFKPVGSLTVSVGGFSGYAEKSRLRVAVIAGTDIPSRGYRTESIGDDGTYTNASLAPGTYTVVLGYSTGSSWQPPRVMDQQQVEIVSGPNRCTVTIAPLYDLTVKLTEEQVDARQPFAVLQVANEDGSGARAAGWERIDRDELTVKFAGLAAGRYVVRVGRLEMPVSIPGPSTVIFTPRN